MSIFGLASSSSSSIFGQPQPSSTFKGVSQTSMNLGLFGAPSSSSSTSIFGSASPSPFGTNPFGAPASQGSMFGSGAPSGGIFSNQPQQQPQPIFGQPSALQQPTVSIFGNVQGAGECSSSVIHSSCLRYPDSRTWDLWPAAAGYILQRPSSKRESEENCQGQKEDVD
jgi:hypothetical protein